MTTSMHFGAKKNIILLARHLRQNMTPAEKELWRYLRKKSLGYKFRNQHPIWRYVVDFYCHSVGLVIEVDGEIHTIEDVARDDQYRQNQLISFGLSIIRFSNYQVFNEIDFVLQEIQRKIEHISIIQKLNNVEIKSPLGDLGVQEA
jgi:imidazole glycerol-phosphate synthase subunit HisF